ncbi:MAG: oligosaccharide flippase family protein [Planctomycetota bacterium]
MTLDSSSETTVSGPRLGASPVPSAQGGTPGSLAQQTTSGFAWLLLQALGSRVVLIGSQLGLAALVSEAAFGVMAMAATAMAVTQLLQQFGLRSVLVQRSSKIRLWVADAQHFAIAVGGIAAIVLAALAPAFAALYDEPAVTPLLLTLAPTALLRAWANVAAAVLHVRMRFRDVAMVSFGESASIAVVGLTLAWLGAEEFALAVPVTLGAMLRCVLLYRLAGMSLTLRIRPRRWRMLISSGGKLFVSRIFVMVLQQADYALLAIFHPAAVVGVYYYAFLISMQTVRLLTVNIGGVLLPALSSMSGDPERALRGFLRSLRLLALLTVPAGLAQAALVEIVFDTLFPGRWENLGPIAQVLSLGMIVFAVTMISGTLLESQRRYMTELVLAAIQAVFFVCLVLFAAYKGAALEVAIAVAVYHSVVGPVRLYVAIRPSGGRWRDIAGVLAPTLLSGVGGGLSGLAAGRAVSGGWPLSEWGGSLVAVAVGLTVYAGLVLITCPSGVKELIAHGSAMASRVLGRFGRGGPSQ